MPDPEPRAFRPIDSEHVPLAFAAFLDVHRECGDAVEFGRSGKLAVAYCRACDDVRTFLVEN